MLTHHFFHFATLHCMHMVRSFIIIFLGSLLAEYLMNLKITGFSKVDIRIFKIYSFISRLTISLLLLLLRLAMEISPPITHMKKLCALSWCFWEWSLSHLLQVRLPPLLLASTLKKLFWRRKFQFWTIFISNIVST